jgi:hypothetical protein
MIATTNIFIKTAARLLEENKRKQSRGERKSLKEIRTGSVY